MQARGEAVLFGGLHGAGEVEDEASKCQAVVAPVDPQDTRRSGRDVWCNPKRRIVVVPSGWCEASELGREEDVEGSEDDGAAGEAGDGAGDHC